MEYSQTLESSTDPPSCVQWAVAVESLNGHAYLSILHLSVEDSGEQVFEDIRRQFRLAPGVGLGGSWTCVCFTKIVVGTAKVHKVITTFIPVVLISYLLIGFRADLRIRPRATSIFPSKR